MRSGKEKEEWDRLSYTLANLAAFQGAKNVKVSDFNPKYSVDPKFTSDDLMALKGKMA
tara:strand:- start:2624 stop:2797 length:174 start_codon:yes stop_codon:yes gene_type:complete